MADLDTVRAAIKAKMQGVSGIGRVHDYERYARTQEQLQEQYVATLGDEKRVLGWWFDRFSTRELDSELTSVRRVHLWRITGYCGVDDDDATRKLVQNLIEALATAFRADRTLGGTCVDIKDMESPGGASGLQVDDVSPIVFCGLLCWRAQLRLYTETIEY